MINRPLYYLALGDSLTVGTGSLLSSDFVDLYSKRIENSFGIQVINKKVAKKGVKTTEFMEYLQKPKTIQLIQQADLITISLGGNDLLKAWKRGKREVPQLMRALTQAKQNSQAIIEYIKYLKSFRNTPYLVRIINLYNPLNIPKASYFVNAYNLHLKTLEEEHIKVADIHQAFFGKEKLLFIDNVHPNRKGYELIADTLHQLGYHLQ